jgi:hypothetical protein
MPPHEKMFLDTTDFDATDGKYAIGAAQDALLCRSDTPVDKKADADLVVELRSARRRSMNMRCWSASRASMCRCRWPAR